MNKIIIGSSHSKIELNVDFLDNHTAKEILKSLPIESTARLWGDEIYFDTGITAPSEGATMDVEVGDVAYWPEGKCLCIFFGKTPASIKDKPVPASEVVIVGRTSLEPAELRKVTSGLKIRVE